MENSSAVYAEKIDNLRFDENSSSRYKLAFGCLKVFVCRHEAEPDAEGELTVSTQSQISISPRRVLVLAPAAMNYLHAQHGHRLVEALRTLGVLGDVRKLGEKIEGSYDLCLLTDLSEFLPRPASPGEAATAEIIAAGEQSQSAAIKHLQARCRTIAGCSFDGVLNYADLEIQRRCQAAGIDTILDFGIYDQSAILDTKARSLYQFLPNGLTSSEQQTIRSEKNDEAERPIPWMFVGYATANRVTLVNRLISRLDPRGFVNMPRLTKAGPNVSQSLSPRQYESVLRKSRYHVSFPQCQHFYLESEHFRLSLLAGCVPVQVISDDKATPPSLPFDYLVFRESEVAEKLGNYNFHELRNRFRADFLSFPSLAAGLASYLKCNLLLRASEDNAVRAA